MLLLRHAESQWNAEGRWQGWNDPPLSAAGKRQAGEAGRKLKLLGFTAVAASDLERARRTAELAAAAMGFTGPVHIEPGLREYDVGHWSGLTRLEIEARWPVALDDWRYGRLAAPPGGEVRDMFLARIVAAVTRVRAAHPAATVLVITHGGVIRSLTRALCGEESRSAHLAGRWFEAGGEGLRAGEPLFLIDPDCDPDTQVPTARSGGSGASGALGASEGEGPEISSPEGESATT